jgi:hypothetical protein
MNKTFSELTVGQRFTINGTEYIKTQEVRVSCCKTINCQAVADPNNRIYIHPSTSVTLNG